MSLLEMELIRHVKVDGKPAFYGSTDIAPLTAENERLLTQLIAQQKTSKAYQGIISSPLQRCHRLAMKFSQACQLPLEVYDDLQEMNFGVFDGVPFDEMAFDNIPLEDVDFAERPLKKANFQGNEQDKNKEIYWSLLEAFFQAPAIAHLPKAETLACFHQRVIQVWQSLIEQQFVIASGQRADDLRLKVKLPKNRRVLVVAHGGVIRMIIAHILQLDWRQASWHQQLQIGNASITRISLSQPYDNNQILQQITTIAMPLLKGHD